MKIEEIMNLDFDQLEARSAEITAEIKNAETVDQLDALEEELEAIEERKKMIQMDIESRKKDIAAVIKGAGDIIEKEEGEKREMPNIEVRKSPEYLDAWVEYQKGRATAEQRALLSENATNGTIAVPTYVEDMIHTAWENNEFFRRIRKTYFPGNLKIGYESEAGAASIHTEGGAAVTEETLVIGTIELISKMLKKWVSVSDEVLDIRGESFVNYIVDELTDKIIKGVISEAAGKMAVSDLAEAYEAAGQTLTTADVVGAAGQLGGEASNPVLITTRAQAAALKAAALSANYGYDPTDGMPLVYIDAMPTDESVTFLGFVADLSGVTANFPNGEDVKIKIDDLTLATSDMVRIIGRLYMAVDVTAPGKVTIITAAE